MLLLVGVLAGCVPAADDRPAVAVLNAPRPIALDVLADRLTTALEGPSAPYRTVDRMPLAFLETRSNLDDSGVYANAARVARNRGATLAILVSLPDPQRTILADAMDVPYAVEATVYTEAITIHAADGRVVDRRVSPLLTGRRDVTGPDDVPATVRADPLVVALAERSIDDLAPELDGLLRRWFTVPDAARGAAN